MVVLASFEKSGGKVTVSCEAKRHATRVGAAESILPEGQSDWLVAQKCGNDVVGFDDKKESKLAGTNVLMNLEIFFKLRIQSGLAAEIISVKPGAIQLGIELADPQAKAENIHFWNPKKKGWESVFTLAKRRSIENLVINGNRCDFFVLRWPAEGCLIIY